MRVQFCRYFPQKGQKPSGLAWCKNGNWAQLSVSVMFSLPGLKFGTPHEHRTNIASHVATTFPPERAESEDSHSCGDSAFLHGTITFTICGKQICSKNHLRRTSLQHKCRCNKKRLKFRRNSHSQRPQCILRTSAVPVEGRKTERVELR